MLGGDWSLPHAQNLFILAYEQEFVFLYTIRVVFAAYARGRSPELLHFAANV